MLFFTTKEAVLSKPVVSAAGKADLKLALDPALASRTQVNSLEEEKGEQPVQTVKISKSQKRASRRKRSRSKHRAAAEAGAEAMESELNSGQNSASDIELKLKRDTAFILSSEDFPGLDTNDRDKQALQETLASLSLEVTKAEKSQAALAEQQEPSEKSKFFHRNFCLISSLFGIKRSCISEI